MSLYETILADLKQAMKERNAEKLSTLRMLKAGFLELEKSGSVDELTDEHVITVLKQQAKKRKESIQSFQDAGRDELAENEMNELAIIETYLPEQMSEDDIRVVVQGVIDQVGSDNFGAVMGASMKQLNGQADGDMVRKVVESLL